MALHRTHDWIRAFAFATRNVEVMLAVAGLLGTSVPNFRFLFQENPVGWVSALCRNLDN